MLQSMKQIRTILMAAMTAVIIFTVAGIITGQEVYAAALEEGKLYLGGQDIVKAEGQTVTGDDGKGTAKLKYDRNGDPVLVLEDYVCECYGEESGSGSGSVIRFVGEEQLTIVIKGINRVTAKGGTMSYGILTNGPLVIKGDGILTAVGAPLDQSLSTRDTVGILSEGDLTIESGTVTAIGGDIIDRENAYESIGIDALSVTINGGIVTASGGDLTSSASGVYSRGISSYHGDIRINGGSVTATGGDVKGNKSYGLQAPQYIIISRKVVKVEASGGTYAADTSLINYISGLGWNDTDGTGTGSKTIAPDENGSWFDYKKILFNGFLSADMRDVTLTPASIQIDNEIDGGPYPLLEVDGEAKGGTLKYALGDEYGPFGEYTESIPKGSGAHQYYVWVRAIGDDDHSDSDPVCLPAKIYIPVTFKVVNGSWNDKKKTKADKVLELCRYDNEDLALVLRKEDFPAVGDNPAEGYKKKGEWSPEPPEEIAVSSAMTYTYTFERKDKNPMTVKGKTVKIKTKEKKLKKTTKISAKKAYKIRKKVGKLTFKKVKANKSSKKFKVDKRTGKITLKKGLKKGKYKLTVKVRDAGNSTKRAKTVKRVVTIKVGVQ